VPEGSGSGTRRGGRYHHGELRAALIEASFDLLAESGLAAFSVAQVARRLGVSTAAPYRHFPDRDHLVAAVAAQAAAELRERFVGAAEEASLTLVEHHVVAAHGYVALYREGFFARRYEGVAATADRAVAESRTLLRGMR
jgi:AcrR family transcriptional regulator